MTEPGLEAAFLHFVGRTGDLEWCGFMDLENVRWFWNEATRQERERCASLVGHWRSACYCGPEWRKRDMHSPGCLWQEGQVVAAAIREQEADDELP